jgi:hypothetical protein
MVSIGVCMNDIPKSNGDLVKHMATVFVIGLFTSMVIAPSVVIYVSVWLG